MARHLFLIRSDRERPGARQTERELARRRHLAALRTAGERHRFAGPHIQLLDDAHARRHLDAA
jgi:hypothetical protein